jgi:hypothetical protein
MPARVLLLLIAFCGLAFAQPKAQISGFVRDSSDAVVREAAISVINLDTGVRRSTQSNSGGFYAVSSLTPGSYKITVRKPGFQTVARTGVQLHALDAGQLDFVLEIGSIHEEITVDAAAPLTNTTDASYGMQTSRRPAEYLPVNGRGLQALIDLAPGVLITPATAGEAGQFSANGQRPATNYFTVDGVSANNGVSGSGLPGQFSGGALPAMTAIGSLHNLVSLAELDEMRVQTSTFAPEYGRLPGAQVAVSTRSGSNALHGEVLAAMRHERAAASDPFANAAGLPRAAQRMTDAGGSLSGPVRRNQTFFLLSTEYIRLRQPVTFLSAVPSLRAREIASPLTRRIVSAFPLPNGPELDGGLASLHTAQSLNPSTVHTTSVRIDQALGGAGTAFVRYNRTPSSTLSGYLQQNEANFSSQTLTTGVVTAFSPRVTNDARLGFSRAAVTSTWLPGAADLDLQALLPSPGEGQRLWGVGIRGVGQLLTGDPGRSRQTQWTLTDTIALTTGRHDVRFGIDYQRLSPDRDRPVATATTVYEGLDQLVYGSIPTYTFAQTGGGSSLNETLSLFAQDTWHVTPKLNVTYGVRWELTPPPSYRAPAVVPGSTIISPNPPFLPGTVATPERGFDSSPLWQTRANQFAPRAGFAYRLGENTVLRGGAGLFYDLGFSSAVDLVNGAPYNRWRNVLGGGPNLAFLDAVEYGFARDLRLPYTVQWNAVVERAFGADAAASLGYVGSLGRRLLRREGYLDISRAAPSLILATNHGESSYHSLQAHYRSRNTRGLQGTVSYTWSHAIDNGSWDSASYLVFAGAGTNQDRGSANFDVRHSFQAALAYDLGRTRMPGVRGWLLSGAFRARTGFPIDVVTNEQPFGLGFDNDVRPDIVPGVPVWLGNRLNPAAFTRPAGRQGTLGRNAIRGNGLAQFDVALQREFVASESVRLQLRLEGYNLTNTVNLADPIRVLSSPLFGYSPSVASLMLGAGRPNSGLTPAFQSGGPRLFQAGVTVRF